MKLFHFVCVSLVFSALGSVAGAENLVVCANPEVPERLVIHQDAGGELVALYSAELNWSGGLSTIAIKVHYLATPTERGLSFVGKDFKLSINKESQNKSAYGTLNMQSYDIKNDRIKCQLNR